MMRGLTPAFTLLKTTLSTVAFLNACCFLMLVITLKVACLRMGAKRVIR